MKKGRVINPSLNLVFKEFYKHIIREKPQSKNELISTCVNYFNGKKTELQIRRKRVLKFSEVNKIFTFVMKDITVCDSKENISKLLLEDIGIPEESFIVLMKHLMKDKLYKTEKKINFSLLITMSLTLSTNTLRDSIKGLFKMYEFEEREDGRTVTKVKIDSTIMSCLNAFCEYLIYNNDEKDDVQTLMDICNENMNGNFEKDSIGDMLNELFTSN